MFFKLKVLFVCFSLSRVSGYFTLVGSRVLTFGNDYLLHLTRDHDISLSPANLELELVGKTSGDAHDKTIPLNFDEKIVTFELKRHHTLENFTLTAEIPNTDFKQSVDIYTIARNCSVFIQTDKAIYKPGDDIQIRALVLDAELKPYRWGQVSLNISDANGNVVHEEENFFDISFPGVYTDNLTLSDTPPLGEWKIHVRVNRDDVVERSFEVSESVLPRFSANIISAPHVLITDRLIEVIVYGEYTFGEFVTANAVVSAKVSDGHRSKKIQSAEITAKKKFVFDMTDLNISSPTKVLINVTLEEILTGKKMNESAVINVHGKAAHKIELVSVENKFKPGFPFSIKATILKYDESLEIRQDVKVKFDVSFYNSQSSQAQRLNINDYVQVEKSPKNGFTDFNIEIPKYVEKILVKADYMSSEATLEVKRFPSKSWEYLQVKALNESPSVGSLVSIQTASSQSIETLHYVIISNSRMFHNKIKISRPGNSFEFSFKVSQDMIPSVTIVVYYIHLTGEVIYDQVTVETGLQLSNQLAIKLSSKQIAPGARVNISLKTSSKAFVGLLAIDKRVLLQKSSNDIGKQRVFDDHLRSNSGAQLEPLKFQGPDSIYHDFGGQKTFILTDAGGKKPDQLVSRFGDDDDDYFDLIHLTNPADESAVRVRKEFPETWLFEGFEVDDNGQASFLKTVPDSITSWMFTGFSIDVDNGLGIAEPKTLLVRQKFFIKLNLPYSIRWGEVLKVDVSVFNYGAETSGNLTVGVVLYTDQENSDFQLISKKPRCVYVPSGRSRESKDLSVAPNSVSSTYFYIKPLKVGKIKLKVKAVGREAKCGDEIETYLRVEHDGITNYRNKPILIDLSESAFDSFFLDFSLDITSDAIPKSIKIGASAIGDLLGPALVSVSNLIRLPTGCGEQRLVTFVATAVATNYLSSVNQLSASHKKNSQQYLRTGYYQMLERKNPDGSFNLWGYEKSDSVWLTAYVAKCLGQVKDLVSINDIHIYDALSFLRSKQKPSGSFSEHGPISHRRIQGELSHGVPLTAYVAISFLENPKYIEDYKHLIHKALNFIDSNGFNLTDNHAIAVSAYALVLGKHKGATHYLSYLKSKAKSQEGKTYWTKDLEPSLSEAEANISVMVEIAAYALLAFLKSGDKDYALTIMHWLTSKRNSEGGFYSTQDTIISLQALAEIAKVFHSPVTDMNIRLSYQATRRNIKIDESNRLNLQDFELPSVTRRFGVNANGTGIALLNVWSSYSTKSETSVEAFSIIPKLLYSKHDGIFYLKACVSSTRESSKSSMAVMEITLPSGYVYDSDLTDELIKKFGVKKVETRDSKTLVMLYFDKIPDNQLCPEIKAIRMQNIEQRKSSPIKIYDYYDSEKRAVVYYTPVGAHGCQ